MPIYPQTKIEKYSKSKAAQLTALIVAIALMLCLGSCRIAHNCNVYTPSKKEINNAMSKSDWRYTNYLKQ